MTVSDDILDDILSQTGGNGKYQVLVLICICSVMVLHSATHIAYVFTSMDTEYRCLISECENNIALDAKWLEIAVPFSHSGKPKKCLQYEYFNVSSSIYCHPNNFDRTRVTKCTIYSFYDDDEYFLNREFDLLCEDNLWILSLVGTTNTFGLFLGLIFTGFISDRYGRKRVLLLGMSGCGIVGLIKTFSPSFYWFLAFELLEAILSAGTCICVFILGVELVVPTKRALVSTILNSAYAIGEVLIAVVAWMTKSWKFLIYYTYAPCALLILLYFILPESVRWQLSKGKIKESQTALSCMAKVNKKLLSEDTLNKLETVKGPAQKKNKFSEILKSRRLFWRFANCCFGWTTCAFLFYGITLNSVSLYGNKYLDFVLISLTELPAYWSCNFVVDRIGRRKSICGAYLTTVLACLCFIFTPKSAYWFYLFIYCMGKFGATIAFHVIYIITGEMFPTPLRHTVMGLCSTVGRLGSMTSPQIPLLAQIWEPLPLIMFSLMSGAAGLLSLFFPETKGIKLPDTVDEAEEIK